MSRGDNFLEWILATRSYLQKYPIKCHKIYIFWTYKTWSQLILPSLTRIWPYRGCTESNCTGVIFICFHQFILPIMLHMTKYDLETLIEYIFSYFLVRLLNPCWSAFWILTFKLSNILRIGAMSNSFVHFQIFLINWSLFWALQLLAYTFCFNIDQNCSIGLIWGLAGGLSSLAMK